MKKSIKLWIRNLLIPEQKLREAMELYPGKLRDEVRELLWKELVKKLVPGAVLAVVFLVLAFFAREDQAEGSGRLRPAPGDAAVSTEVLLEFESGVKEITLPIFSREYAEAEIEVLYQEAQRYLEAVVLGTNEDFQTIRSKLSFPEQLPETAGGGSIYWSTDAPWLVTAEGEVLNEELLEAEDVTITAELAYGSESRYYVRTIKVCPKEYTGEEALLRAAKTELLQSEQQSRTEEQFVLPETVLGYPVKWKEQTGFEMGSFLGLVAGVVPVMLYAGYFSDLEKRRKQRKEQAEGCYTEFITKLSLMLAAGVSVRQAFCRLAEEYEGRYGSGHVLAAELMVTKQELENGRSEMELYEAFGQRIGVLPYQRMASLLTQNVSRGVHGLRTLLLQEAKEVMAQERANIKIKGEQAGTKLLFPMMGLLFLVFAILLVPAFQSF